MVVSKRVLNIAFLALTFVALSVNVVTRIKLAHVDPLSVGHLLGPISGLDASGQRVDVPDRPCHLIRYGSRECPACRDNSTEWEDLRSAMLAKGCNVVLLAPEAGLLESDKAEGNVYRLQQVNEEFVRQSRFTDLPTIALTDRNWRVIWSHAGSLEKSEVNSISASQPESLSIALLRPVEFHVPQQSQASANPRPAPPVAASLDSTVSDVPLAGSPSLGPQSAPVVLVEFSDFQCPFCARAAEPLRQIQAEFPTKVRLVYKQFPLNSHRFARQAATLSVLTDNNRFWQLYDSIFKTSPRLSETSLRAMAEGIGIDWGLVANGLGSSTVQERIDHDIALGRSLGVEGTPALFVNGRRYRGVIDSQNLRRIVLDQFGRSELLGPPAK